MAQAQQNVQSENHSKIKSENSTDVQSGFQNDSQAKLLEEQLEQQQQLRMQIEKEKQHSQPKQQQFVHTQFQHSQKGFSNDEDLILSESLPSQSLGQIVQTTIVSQPAIVLTHTPSALKEIHGNTGRIDIERNALPQLEITQPATATATVQTQVIHSPIASLLENDNGLRIGSYPITPTGLSSKGRITETESLVFNDHGRYGSGQLLNYLGTIDLPNAFSYQSTTSGSSKNERGNADNGLSNILVQDSYPTISGNDNGKGNDNDNENPNEYGNKNGKPTW